MKLYQIVIKEKNADLLGTTLLTKTFTFMDETLAQRLMKKIKSINADFQDQIKDNPSNLIKINQDLKAKYPNITIDFSHFDSVNLKEVCKVNTSLECLEFDEEIQTLENQSI